MRDVWCKSVEEVLTNRGTRVLEKGLPKPLARAPIINFSHRVLTLQIDYMKLAQIGQDGSKVIKCVCDDNNEDEERTKLMSFVLRTRTKQDSYKFYRTQHFCLCAEETEVIYFQVNCLLLLLAGEVNQDKPSR